MQTAEFVTIPQHHAQTFPDADRLQSAVFSPSGDRLVRLDATTTTGVHLNVIAPQTGRVTDVIALPFSSLVMGPLESRAVVARLDNERAMLVAGRAGDRQIVVRYDLETGMTDELFGAEIGGSRGRWHVTSETRTDPTELVSMSGFSEMYDTGEAIVRVWRLGERWELAAEHRIPSGPTIGTTSLSTGAQPILLPGLGMLLVASGDVTAAITGVYLDTGETVRALAPTEPSERQAPTPMMHTITLTPDGRWLAMAGLSRSKTSLYVRDTTQRRWVGMLTIDRDLINPVPQLSSDGRKLLSIGIFSTGPAGGRGGPYVNELVFHDLAALVGAPETDGTR